MTGSEFLRLVREVSESRGLDEMVVLGVIGVESGFNRLSIRYEPKMHERVVSKHAKGELVGMLRVATTPSIVTELVGRAMSWGYMQVLGETARTALKWRGRYFTELLGEKVNIELGCEYLARMLKMSNGDIRLALLKYNGGGDKGYADRVINFMAKGGAYERLASIDDMSDGM